TRFSRDWSSDVCSFDLTFCRKNTILIIYVNLGAHNGFSTVSGVNKEIVQNCLCVFGKMHSEVQTLKNSVPTLGFYIPIKPNLFVFKKKRIINPIFNFIMLWSTNCDILISYFDFE